jgi:hypothetical protein
VLLNASIASSSRMSADLVAWQECVTARTCSSYPCHPACCTREASRRGAAEKTPVLLNASIASSSRMSADLVAWQECVTARTCSSAMPLGCKGSVVNAP